jgi:O-antigen/teichoic acid export membrane protein
LAEESLKNKAVRGVMWSFLDQAGTMGIGFIIGIILARLLSPSEYGLLEIIAVVFIIMIYSFLKNILVYVTWSVRK